ncbi:hypothetical protein BGZ65_002474, partial [Modicella reniformis]
MPPLQPTTTFELATAIPFADQTTSSPFDKLFDTEPSVEQFTTTTTTTTSLQYTAPMQQPLPSNGAPLPSEVDISALFGLPTLVAQQPTAAPTPVPMAPHGRRSPPQPQGKRPMAASPAPLHETFAHRTNTTVAQDSTKLTHPSYPLQHQTPTSNRTVTQSQAQ